MAAAAKVIVDDVLPSILKYETRSIEQSSFAVEAVKTDQDGLAKSAIISLV